LTAAVSDQVERKETEELTCLMAEGKTEGKAKKKLIILSIGIPNQEETAKWAVRNPKGGLTVEQKYAFHNQSDNFLTEEEHSLGSTIAWTVNWHHNAHQRKVVDGIWTDNDTSFIVVDARLGPEEGRMAHRSVKTDGQYPGKRKTEEGNFQSWKTSGGIDFRPKGEHH
jgi:hypothetical protein